MRHCPSIASIGNDPKKVSISVPGGDATKKNRSYALHSRSEEESSPDVGDRYVTSLLY